MIDCLKMGRVVRGSLIYGPWSSSALDRLNFIGNPANASKHCIEDLSSVKYAKVFAWVLEREGGVCKAAVLFVEAWFYSMATTSLR